MKHITPSRGHFTLYELQPTLQGKILLCIPFLGIAWPQYQFSHSCVCERSIVPGMVHIFPPAEEADRLWEYLNLSQTHDCGNWD
jgi:hypothetical protein